MKKGRKKRGESIDRVHGKKLRKKREGNEEHETERGGCPSELGRVTSAEMFRRRRERGRVRFGRKRAKRERKNLKRSSQRFPPGFSAFPWVCRFSAGVERYWRLCTRSRGSSGEVR